MYVDTVEYACKPQFQLFSDFPFPFLSGFFLTNSSPPYEFSGGFDREPSPTSLIGITIDARAITPLFVFIKKKRNKFKFKIFPVSIATPNSSVTNQGSWINMNPPLGLDRVPLIRRSNRVVCEVRSVHDVTDTSVIPNIIIFFSASFPGPSGH